MDGDDYLFYTSKSPVENFHEPENILKQQYGDRNSYATLAIPKYKK